MSIEMALVYVPLREFVCVCVCARACAVPQAVHLPWPGPLGVILVAPRDINKGQRCVFQYPPNSRGEQAEEANRRTLEQARGQVGPVMTVDPS